MTVCRCVHSYQRFEGPYINAQSSLILSFHLHLCLPSRGFQNNDNMHAVSPIRATCPGHNRLLDLIRVIPHILESKPHPNLIRTSFCRFLKRKKKKLVRGSNPHLSFNRPLPTRQTNSVMSDDGESDE